MIQTEVEELLAERIGLDANSIGTQAVQRAMTICMAAINVTDTYAYLSQLRASERELAELIENIVVSETWFYRDREAFAAMVHLLKRKEKAGFVPLRILSLPCATGEEPYSIVMAMLDAGFSPHQFRVDAIDISRNALTQAREGLYGKNSFRGSELGLRAPFHVRSVGTPISPTVRDSVEFQEGNVLDAGFALRPDRYDAIFCRNMLIYFGAEAQDQAIRALLRRLEADGTLFVGPSETAILAEHGLVPESIPFAFAYQRRGPAPNKPDQAPVRFPTTRAASPQASASKAFAPKTIKPKTFKPETFAPNAARTPVPVPVPAESAGRPWRDPAACRPGPTGGGRAAMSGLFDIDRPLS